MNFPPDPATDQHAVERAEHLGHTGGLRPEQVDQIKADLASPDWLVGQKARGYVQRVWREKMGDAL